MPFIIQRSQEEAEPEVDDAEEQVFEIERAPEGPKSMGEDIAGEYEELAEFMKSGGKGLLEGITRLGRIMGPLQDPEGRPEKEIQEEFTERLEEVIPAEREEGFVQRGLRRGLGEAPTMLAFPGSQLGTLSRSMLEGFVGERAKELGLPEWAQTAAEITAYIGPDITKKLLESGRNKDLIIISFRWVDMFCVHIFQFSV